MKKNLQVRYFFNRFKWYLLTFLVAVTINFVLPRVGPANPVDTIMTRLASPGMDSKEYLRLYHHYMKEFNLDKPVIVQFLTYVGKCCVGDLGTSFTKHPLTVHSIIANALPWTLGLQIPALTLGWLIGNILGALAAYKRGVFDRVLYPVALFLSAIPYFCFAIVLVLVFGILLAWLPPMGAYGQHLVPAFSVFESLAVYYETRFGERIDAVNAVGYELKKGEVLGIAGESGCGKSTLVYGIMGLFLPPLFYHSGQVVIADEPTSALDVSTQKSVIQLLRNLLEQEIVGSMIFITHELPLLYHVADTIAVMYAGEFVETGPCREVITAPRHPYSIALMESMLLPQKEFCRRSLTALPGTPPRLTRIPEGCRFADRCPRCNPQECPHLSQQLRTINSRNVRCHYV